MKKGLRVEVYNKFNGLCAYTGKPLDERWQVDHMEPPFYARMYMRDPNRIENLFPALRIVNHYKRCKNLEDFRQYMQTFHTRLKKLPKNPKAHYRVKYKAYMLQVAEVFDISADKPFDGKFYFEKICE